MSSWVAYAIIVGLLIWCTLTTVLFLRALDKVILASDRTHDRMSKHLETALDRIMAADFAEFKSQQMSENAPQGEYISPDPEEWAAVVSLPLESS